MLGRKEIDKERYDITAAWWLHEIILRACHTAGGFSCDADSGYIILLTKEYISFIRNPVWIGFCRTQRFIYGTGIVAFNRKWGKRVQLQIFSVLRFFRLSFQFYPKKLASICGLSLRRTQIREKWELCAMCCTSVVYIWERFSGRAKCTVSACDWVHIRAWNTQYHALI